MFSITQYLNQLKVINLILPIASVIHRDEVCDIRLSDENETLKWQSKLDSDASLLQGPDGRIFKLVTDDSIVQIEGIGELFQVAGPTFH